MSENHKQLTLDCSVNLQLRGKIIRRITKQFVEELPLRDAFFLHQNPKAHLHHLPHYHVEKWKQKWHYNLRAHYCRARSGRYYSIEINTSNEGFSGIGSHQRPCEKRVREENPWHLSQQPLTHSAIARVSTDLSNNWQKNFNLMSVWLPRKCTEKWKPKHFLNSIFLSPFLRFLSNQAKDMLIKQHNEVKYWMIDRSTRDRSEIAGAGAVKILRKFSTVTSILARTWTKKFRIWTKPNRMINDDDEEIVTSEGETISA